MLAVVAGLLPLLPPHPVVGCLFLAVVVSRVVPQLKDLMVFIQH